MIFNEKAITAVITMGFSSNRLAFDDVNKAIVEVMPGAELKKIHSKYIVSKKTSRNLKNHLSRNCVRSWGNKRGFGLTGANTCSRRTCSF